MVTKNMAKYPLAPTLFPEVLRLSLEHSAIFSKNHVALLRSWQQGDFAFFEKRLVQVRSQPTVRVAHREEERESDVKIRTDS
jgi:hypothetical protein